VFKIIQAKKKNYCDQRPVDHFFPLAIKVFGCLNKQVDVILHNCANAMWNFKGLEGRPFYILVSFFCQNISITLQRMQTSSIFKSSGSNRSSYFPTFTLSKHTPHHHS
jgi:hypothetical protein